MSRKEYLPFGRPNFSEREIAAVTRVLRSGWIGMGPETIAFEKELATAVGARDVVTVNSCTSALFLSVVAAGVQPGDEVICPSLTWCSTANAALYAGATPVFCDIDGDTLGVTPDLVLPRLTPKTKAVIVVHYGGLAIDVAALRCVLPDHVRIIEDAAHAFGAKFDDGSPVGSSGNLTCFSFYANKNLSTAEGGAVALSDDTIADRLRSLRQHALPLDAWKRYSQPHALLLSNQLTEIGYKMNYTDLQAALGRVQLARQAEFETIRLSIAQHYLESLRNAVPPIRFQARCTHPYHARHLFVIRLPLTKMRLRRDEVLVALRSKNIGASVHYAPLHTMPLYCRGDAPPDLQETSQVAKEMVTLPISASMKLSDARDVTSELSALLGLR